MKLRPYQQEAVDAVIKARDEGFKAPLVVIPTGGGKTVVFAHAIQQVLKPGQRALVIAHRAELIYQAADKIRKVTGEYPDIEMANERADAHFFRRSRVVVSTVQTQTAGRNGGRMRRFDPNQFGLVIIDEAHHATAKSYRRIIDHYSSSGETFLLGVTATPDRSDREALGQVFDHDAYTYEIEDAIDDGWLVPIEQNATWVDGLDYSGARTTAGDLNQRDAAMALKDERVLQQIAHAIVEKSLGRKTLVFAPPGFNKEGEEYRITERLAEIIERRCPGQTAIVTQDTDKNERRRILSDYAEGRFRFLVNCAIFTEGFDDPTVEVVAVARATKSRSLYAQMLGRGTRPLDGLVDPHPTADARKSAIAASSKPRVTILDFEGNAGRHALVNAMDVLGGRYTLEEINRAKQNSKKKAGDVDEALQQARRELEAERAIEQERLRKLAERRRHILGDTTHGSRIVDPFVRSNGAAGNRVIDAGGLIPNGIRRFLEGRGVDTAGMSSRQAHAIHKSIVQSDERQARAIAAQLYGGGSA